MKVIAPLSIIFFAVILRLLPHPANVAPIAAMALFGGVYLNKRYALVVPLLALFLSDIFLGFYSEMPFVYGSFLVTGLSGLWLRSHRKVHYIIGATLVSSVFFYIITNFGVWLMGTMYAKDLKGLMECYTLALPFFRNTIIGDFFYVGIFFGSFELIKSLVHTYANLHTNRR